MLNLKKFRPAFILLAFVALLALVSCNASSMNRLQPVLNIDKTPVVELGSQPATSLQIRNAIIIAGTSLGWDIVPTTSGHVVGTLNLRSHQAVIDIIYSDKQYAITYKNSQNLRYDGTKIHRNYNGWIQNLNKAIKTEILRINT